MKHAGPEHDAVAPHRARRWGRALVIAGLVGLLNLIAWWALHMPQPAPEAAPRVAGLAYNAFDRWQSPLDGDRPQRDRLEADLRTLSGFTGRIRTYSTLETPDLPRLASRLGLEVTAGAWLDGRADHNQRELDAVVAAARAHRSITRVIAGNETQLHGTVGFDDLTAALDRLRRELDVPVSTAEPWHVWLRRPELARHVDFITVHLLPYWEQVPVEAAVDEAMRRFQEVRQRFPGQRVVIGEIGWPSGGDRRGAARAGVAEQALFIRTFLARVASAPPDYYLMEAVDQPWKRATEGPAGPHWGLLDADRQPKFAFAGPVSPDPRWGPHAVASSLVAVALALPLLVAASHWRWRARLALGLIVQAVASLLVFAATAAFATYLRPLDVLLMALLVPALLLTGALLVVQGFEFAELFWDGGLRRRLGPRTPSADRPAAFVSLHLACSREPPAMVIDTIEHLRAMDWPAFEIVVVDNNTPDPSDWRPVADHVESIERERLARGGFGPRVRFVRRPHCPGFKAEALNVALAHTDPRATWIGVVDADYRVEPDWLASLAGHFEDPRVAVVQAPQAHRDVDGPAWRRWMNWEYEGFFRLGMHHRHERDALVQHGTMTLIRRAALDEVGGWSTTTLCEDTELGLRLLAQGHRLVYVDERYGAGLLPADFAAYRRQRQRWAQGAMQILRQNAGSLLGRSRLRFAQRYHFVAGWLPWIGDALHLVFSLAALAWTIGLLAAPHAFAVPALGFLVPLAVFFAVRVVGAPLLYGRRVGCSLGDLAGAAVAGMALSHPIARGVWAGVAGQAGTFVVTRKGAASRARRDAGLREERVLLTALALAAFAMVVRRPAGEAEMFAWVAVLTLQAVPYAVAIAFDLYARHHPPSSSADMSHHVTDARKPAVWTEAAAHAPLSARTAVPAGAVAAKEAPVAAAPRPAHRRARSMAFRDRRRTVRWPSTGGLAVSRRRRSAG